LAKRGVTVKQVAEELGVSAKWIRGHITAGTITPERQGNKRNGRFLLSDADVETLRTRASEERPTEERPAEPEGGDTTALARISQLEADRANLLAQVAWARAISQEQQKALEIERERAEKLDAELEAQRSRVEALKALSVLDRALGRHKAI